MRRIERVRPFPRHSPTRLLLRRFQPVEDPRLAVDEVVGEGEGDVVESEEGHTGNVGPAEGGAVDGEDGRPGAGQVGGAVDVVEEAGRTVAVGQDERGQRAGGVAGDAEDRAAGGRAAVGERGVFEEVAALVPVEVEVQSTLRGGGGGGERLVGPGSVVREGAGFIRADVRRADDGETALVAGERTAAALRAGLPGSRAIVCVGPP